MSIATIAASGMNAATLRQQVAASNVARQGVTTTTSASGGVSASVTVEPVDALAPVSDLVNSLSAGSDFKANAKVLERADEMIGSLLDVVA